MNAKDLNLSFDLVSYVGQYVKLVNKKKWFSGPCPMCGGKDRFTIKRKSGDVWLCRKCTVDGKYHTPIDFVMQFHNLDFKQAVEHMGGDLEHLLPTSAQHVHPTPVQVAPDQNWQTKAWEQVHAAAHRLSGIPHDLGPVEFADYLSSGKQLPEGKPGRDYLLARGLDRGSWSRWLLGYGIVFNRPAIFIPYTDIGHVITAIKYRFIDERARKDKGARFSMLGGSLPYLFGLQLIQHLDKTLLFVEGELNAISVSQVLPAGVAVVSAGSESNGNAVLVHALAARFDRVVIWMDDPFKAAIMRDRMGRDAMLIQSPVKNDTKWDANEMLKAGVLREFLTRLLKTNCMDLPAPIATERALVH